MTELDQTRRIVWVLIKQAVLKVVVRREFMSHLLSINIWITKAAVNKSRRQERRKKKTSRKKKKQEDTEEEITRRHPQKKK